jgi:hypothetical protein
MERQQCNSLNHRLRHQRTVKRICMNCWQILGGDDMSTENWQLGVAIVQQAAAQESGIDFKIRTAQSTLALDLPQAGGTEEQLVAGVVQQETGLGGGCPAARSKRCVSSNSFIPDP